MVSFIWENPYLIVKMKRIGKKKKIIPIHLFSVKDSFGCCCIRNSENL